MWVHPTDIHVRAGSPVFMRCIDATPKEAAHVLEHLPDARKVIMDDAAHLPIMEHPERFQRIVGAFLEELA